MSVGLMCLALRGIHSRYSVVELKCLSFGYLLVTGPTEVQSRNYCCGKAYRGGIV